jgi:uncharacterized membrane protein
MVGANTAAIHQEPPMTKITGSSFKTGVSIAATAAFLAVSSLATAIPANAQDNATAAKVQPCYGVNSCKGTSDCKSGTHDCKGMNACKGQGFKALTTSACAAAGGSLTAPK